MRIDLLRGHDAFFNISAKKAGLLEVVLTDIMLCVRYATLMPSVASNIEIELSSKPAR